MRRNPKIRGETRKRSNAKSNNGGGEKRKIVEALNSLDRLIACFAPGKKTKKTNPPLHSPPVPYPLPVRPARKAQR